MTSTIEDGTDENATDGILVVQVRRLRTISREISELADPERAEIEAPGFVTRAAYRSVPQACACDGAGPRC
jgi:hypothetical protein